MSGHWIGDVETVLRRMRRGAELHDRKGSAWALVDRRALAPPSLVHTQTALAVVARPDVTGKVDLSQRIVVKVYTIAQGPGGPDVSRLDDFLDEDDRLPRLLTNGKRVREGLARVYGCEPSELWISRRGELVVPVHPMRRGGSLDGPRRRVTACAEEYLELLEDQGLLPEVGT